MKNEIIIMLLFALCGLSCGLSFGVGLFPRWKQPKNFIIQLILLLIGVVAGIILLIK